MAMDNGDSAADGMNEINITPFVDVVLVLLVIFMVTAPAMIAENLKVNLPKTLTSDLAPDQTTLGITITKEGQTLLAGKLLDENSLQVELAKIAASNPQTHFLLSADVDSRHGAVVKVIDLLRKNSLSHFALQIEKIVGPAP